MLKILRCSSQSFLLIATMLASSVGWSREFKIELVVFDRTESRWSTDELFRPDITLSYPSNYRFLAPAQTSATQTDSSDHIASLDNRALYELDSSQYQLNREASAIERRTAMRVLFHKAWRQDLTSEANAPFVVINGGKLFDGRSELGGGITLHLSKYIHLTTDLWLTRFTTNEAEEGLWPIPPLAPQDQTDSRLANTTSLGGNNLTLGERMRASAGLSNYAVQEVLTLKQMRRMRSNETHYIDHPLMGILILIQPV